MKRTFLTLLAITFAALSSSACDDTADSLTNGQPTGGTRTPQGPTGGDDGYHHNDGISAPGSGEEVVDPVQVRVVGSPEVTSRLHGCGKMTVASLDHLLRSRGLNGGGQRPQGAQSGRQIFDARDTPAALGAANYDGRVPEAPFSSTSAISKMFDIFTMAAYDAVAENWEAPACPGVRLLEGGKFTRDGLTCLMGKPATEEHVAIANDAIAQNPTDGAKIAIAALLAAAHTCQ